MEEIWAKSTRNFGKHNMAFWFDLSGYANERWKRNDMEGIHGVLYPVSFLSEENK